MPKQFRVRHCGRASAAAAAAGKGGGALEAHFSSSTSSRPEGSSRMEGLATNRSSSSISSTKVRSARVFLPPPATAPCAPAAAFTDCLACDTQRPCPLTASGQLKASHPRTITAEICKRTSVGSWARK